MGFIPSLKTVSIALKLLSGCLMRFREGINPSPTLIGMLSIIFNCALIGLNPEPSYETTGEYNSEPQNVEGWFRCAQSFINFYKKDRIHSFDIRYSLFDKLSKAEVSFSIRPTVFLPAAGLKPETFTLCLRVLVAEFLLKPFNEIFTWQRNRASSSKPIPERHG